MSANQSAQHHLRATYTPEELAQALDISSSMTYRMLKKGEIPHRKAGKKYIIPKAAVDEWLKTAPTASVRRSN